MILKNVAVSSLITSTMLAATELWAQEAGQAAQQPNPIASFAPVVIIFVIFYFLMIRPQKKKMQDEQTMLNSLAKGDEVYTKSGFIGTITGMTDKVVTLEVSEGVKLKVIRGQIGGLAKQLFESKSGNASSTGGKLVKQ